MTPRPTPDPTCKYETCQPEQWAETDFSVGPPDGGTVRVSGICPRCGHDFVNDVITYGTGVRFAPETTYRVDCACLESHEDRPSGKYGCGAFGGVDIAARR
jgi:hypothetical protein